jgi:hypothetical protein
MTGKKSKAESSNLVLSPTGESRKGDLFGGKYVQTRAYYRKAGEPLQKIDGFGGNSSIFALIVMETSMPAQNTPSTNIHSEAIHSD